MPTMVPPLGALQQEAPIRFFVADLPVIRRNEAGVQRIVGAIVAEAKALFAQYLLVAKV
jgi:hypothetical protein